MVPFCGSGSYVAYKMITDSMNESDDYDYENTEAINNLSDEIELNNLENVPKKKITEHYFPSENQFYKNCTNCDNYKDGYCLEMLKHLPIKKSHTNKKHICNLYK